VNATGGGSFNFGSNPSISTNNSFVFGSGGVASSSSATPSSFLNSQDVVFGMGSTSSTTSSKRRSRTKRN